MYLVIQITLWLLSWTFVFGFYELVMVPRGIDHLKKFYLTTIYWAFFSVVCFLIFQSDIRLLVPYISTTSVIILITYFLITCLIHFIVIKKFKSPTQFIKHNPGLYFAPLDWSHLLSNSFIILFQQIMFVAVISIMLQNNLTLPFIILILVLLSFIVHITLTKKLGNWWGWYFAIFSMSAAIVYPLLIINLNQGILYAFIIQSIYYSVSGIGVWLLHQPKE